VLCSCGSPHAKREKWLMTPTCPLACPQVEDDESSPEALAKALHWTYWTGGALTLVMVIFWPLLAIPAGVFSKGYFTM
jgi:hypothetical protein